MTDLTNRYCRPLAASDGRCGVRSHGHSVGGISINDFVRAAKIDALWS